MSQTIKMHLTSKASIRNLSNIALPLMLNNLSYNLMLFLDRFIIARSSTEEMNAAVTIGMACSIVLFSLSAIASTAEIFVGRYYGSKSFGDIGKPVWQMIWFSLATFIIFIPLGLFADTIFIPAQYKNIGLSFFQWYMFGGPIFPLVMALTAFYLGRSEIKLVTITIILSNIVNLILAMILVLGVDPWIPALGMKGAAMATIAAQIFQAIVLFSVFISKKYKQKFGTNHFQLNYKLYMECLKIGSPLALGYLIEMGAWALLLRTLSHSGDKYITVFAIGQSLFVLFIFISESMQKSITITASQLIGGQKIGLIAKLFRSALGLHAIFSILIAMILMIFSDFIIASFTIKTSMNDIVTIQNLSKFALFYFWLFFIFDGIKWIIASILIALKKTVPIMLVNFACVWLFMVLPAFVLIGFYQYPPLTVWTIVIVYSFINTSLLLVYWKLFVNHEENTNRYYHSSLNESIF